MSAAKLPYVLGAEKRKENVKINSIQQFNMFHGLGR